MSSSAVTVKASILRLSFKADLYRSLSVRDSITRLVKDPFASLKGNSREVVVADDLSFEIKRGDRIGILGVNGAGKTSLCRCLSGMYRPNSGRVQVFGAKRAVFDTAIGVQPELTGRENAELLCKLMFYGDPDKKAIVEDAISFSGLGEFIDVPFRIYSKGMQMRLILSLVSAKPCDFLILDEVFDGADHFFTEKVVPRVLKMIEASGSVLFVSHSMEQLKKVCNRLWVYDKGKITFDGSVEKGIEFYLKTHGSEPSRLAT
jgi:ABC-type polysaccharide/polyol phosphate transport system ATPase subunit